MKCSHGHEHGSIMAAAACSQDSKAPEPRRCDENAGGCGRSELEGAVLRDGSALCGACEEANAEASADDVAKLAAAKALVAKDRAKRRQSARDWKGNLQPAGVIRANQIADAFHEVGKANHYMVGVTIEFNREELEAAEQILIDRQNAGPQKGKSFQALEHALDAIEHERFVRFVMAERAKPGGAK